MKKTYLFNSLAVIVLASLLFARGAAAATLVYVDGDLFMGFRSANAANDYLVDIGQYTKFDGHPSGYHLALGDWGTDLVAVFGSGWPTDPNIQWGSAGTHNFDSNNNVIANLFASKAEPVTQIRRVRGGVEAAAWPRQSSSAQTGSASAIETMAYGDFYGNSSTADNPTGFIQAANGTSPSWASFMPGGANTASGSSFSTWVPTVEAPIQPGTGTGIVNTRLDLFKILPDSTGTNPASTYVGTFSVDAGGNVSFDVFAFVLRVH